MNNNYANKISRSPLKKPRDFGNSTYNLKQEEYVNKIDLEISKRGGKNLIFLQNNLFKMNYYKFMNKLKKKHNLIRNYYFKYFYLLINLI